MASDDDSDGKSTVKESPKKDNNDNFKNDPTYLILITRNPFYLHPSENPDATIVAPHFDDNNYHNWSKSMCRALTSKNKISFINGNLPKHSFSDQNYELWDRLDSMVLSWINCTLSPHIAHSTIYFDSTFDLYEDLCKRFTKGNHFRFSDLFRDLYSIHQGDRSLPTYFIDLKIL